MKCFTSLAYNEPFKHRKKGTEKHRSLVALFPQLSVSSEGGVELQVGKEGGRRMLRNRQMNVVQEKWDNDRGNAQETPCMRRIRAESRGMEGDVLGAEQKSIKVVAIAFRGCAGKYSES